MAFWLSRQGAELVRVGSRVVAALGPEMGENSCLSQKRQHAPGEGVNCKAALFKRGQPQDNLAGRLGICQSKMLFHLTAWGGLFLPLASPGGDKGPSCGLCTALE